MWHRWQSIGALATSMRSLFDPCGSWQVAQFCVTGACSQRYGPRFSVWQLVHASVIQLPVFSMRTLVDPCGLWQDVQSILPSRTGMWPDFRSFVASCLWQLAQVSMTDFVLSWAWSDFGLCTEWHVVHERSRALCMLDCHCAWLPRLWQVKQVAALSRADITLKRLIFSLFPESSTCALPLP